MKQLKETWKNLKQQLDHMKEGKAITVDQPLLCVNGNIPSSYQIRLKSSYNIFEMTTK